MIESVQAWSAGLSWYWGSPVAALAAAQSASAASATTTRRRASVTFEMSSATRAGGIARTSEALLGAHVAAEHHQRLDRFGHERRRLVRVREGVRAGPRRLGAAAAGGVDLSFDDARVAVVDGAENRDRAAVAARVADEELSSRAGGLAHDGAAALRAAWATVSLSANPVSFAASAAGRT